jgi:hypothetical protein
LKSTLTSVDEPPLLALPRQTPLPSFLNSLTLEKPAPLIFDLAWPSVKLLRPATGAFELFCHLVGRFQNSLSFLSLGPFLWCWPN